MSTRYFKSSGPIGLNEIKIFIDGDDASAVHSNIKLGTMFSEGQSLSPQPVVLPNGNFVAPHSMSEFYDASILTSSIEITSIEEAMYDLVLNVNSPAGSASAASGAGTYPHGTVVNISASFNSSNEEFTSWSGGTVASSTSATTTVTMNGDVTLTANIAEKTCEPASTIETIPGRVLSSAGWQCQRFGGHGGGNHPIYRFTNQNIDPENIWTLNGDNQWVRVPTTVDGITGSSWSGYTQPAASDGITVYHRPGNRGQASITEKIIVITGGHQDGYPQFFPHECFYVLGSWTSSGGYGSRGAVGCRAEPTNESWGGWSGNFWVGNNSSTPPTAADITNAAAIVQC